MKGFLIETIAGGDVTQIEYLPASAVAVTAGLALTMTGGKLAVASGETAPSYISAYDSEGEALAEGTQIPVFRVLRSMIFRTTASVAMTAKLGEKVTISADGTQVTSTTDNGVAELVSLDGTEAGDEVRVRF